MLAMIKVLFILNNAPNYRDVFLKELGKKIDLTVMSRSGKDIGLSDPTKRDGYKYIELENRTFFGVIFNLKQFTEASKDYDVIILRPSIREPFALLNLLRKNRKKILFGHIYSLSYRAKKNRINGFLYKWAFKKTNNFLVHSDYISNLIKEKTNKSIYSFNNTYFFKEDIELLPFNNTNQGLNAVWIGRFAPQKMKNIETLINLAKRNKLLNVRLIGTGLIQGLTNVSLPDNVALYDEIFDDNELKSHFGWCHVVMSPGHIGLLVVNSARFGRPIIIDSETFHAPEIQLAIESDQLFIDFTQESVVDELIGKLILNNELFISRGSKIAKVMKDRYHLNYMVEKFMEAIENE